MGANTSWGGSALRSVRNQSRAGAPGGFFLARQRCVGTSTNSPSALPLYHLPSAETVQREVRSIWQCRYHGMMTVRLATALCSYLPSAIVAFHLPLAYSSSGSGTLKRCRKSSTATCNGAGVGWAGAAAGEGHVPV